MVKEWRNKKNLDKNCKKKYDVLSQFRWIKKFQNHRISEKNTGYITLGYTKDLLFLKNK